jgi:hypothetical protein
MGAPSFSPYLRSIPSGRSATDNGQREPKGGATVVVGKGFEAATVSFNNRTANGKPHTQAMRLCRIKGSKQLGEVGGK